MDYRGLNMKNILLGLGMLGCFCGNNTIAMQNRNAIFDAVKSDNVNNVRAVIAQYGKDVVRSRDLNGRTPLHFAQDARIVNELLHAGAGVDCRDNMGRTPMDWTCYFVHSYGVSLALAETNGVRACINSIRTELIECMAILSENGGTTHLSIDLDNASRDNIWNFSELKVLNKLREQGNVGLYFG